MTVPPGAKLNLLCFISNYYKFFDFILNQVKKIFFGIVLLIFMATIATPWDQYRQIFTVNRPSAGLPWGRRDDDAKRAGLPIQSKKICQPGHCQRENIDADSRGVGA
jgi:hypothetical protein